MSETNGDDGAVVVCAPFAGVARLQVAEGDDVTTGLPVAVVEAVKLEAPVPAPCPATVAKVLVEDFSDVSGGDPLLMLTPKDAPAAGAAGAGAVDEAGGVGAVR